jgi:transposase
MSRMPKAREEAVLSKMLSPNPPETSALAKQEGSRKRPCTIGANSYAKKDVPCRNMTAPSENWSAQTKFAVVVETAELTDTELARYCHNKGLYPEQIKA